MQTIFPPKQFEVRMRQSCCGGGEVSRQPLAAGDWRLPALTHEHFSQIGSHLFGGKKVLRRAGLFGRKKDPLYPIRPSGIDWCAQKLRQRRSLIKLNKKLIAYFHLDPFYLKIASLTKFLSTPIDS